MEDIIGVDIETDKKGKPFCCSATFVSMKTIFFRWKKKIPKKLKFLLTHSISKVFHNASFDVGKLLKECKVKTKGKIYDTVTMAKLSLPFEKRYGLKEIMRTPPFNKKCKEYEEVLYLFKRKKLSYDEMPKDLMKRYNKLDSKYTMRLFFYLKEIVKEPIFKLEQNLLWTIIDMESIGVKFNRELAGKISDGVEKEIRDLNDRLKRGYKLDNPNSPKQISQLLYEDLNLTPPFFKGKEHYTTDSLSLKILYDKTNHPILPYLVKHRKLTSSLRFLKELLNYAVKDIIYPKFNQMGGMDKRRIKTGRFSSSTPNLQNLPRGKDIRQLIIPRKNFFFLGTDYDQIEMRLFAYYADDKMMKEIYRKKGDVHLEHKKIFVDPFRPDHDGKNRQIAKSIGFEIIYGVGAPGMWKSLYEQDIVLDIDIVSEMLQSWHRLHPSLVELKRKLYRELRRNGFIKDIYGRKYYLSLAKSYVAVNYYIQGMSANIIKDVMPKVNRYVKDIGGHLLLTIHDELLTELPLHRNRKRIIQNIEEIMVSPSKKIGIPLVVKSQTMFNDWGEKQ